MKQRLLSALLILGVSVGIMPWGSVRAEEAKALSSGVVAIDIPESRAKLVTLEITDGHFSQYAVGKIRLDLHDVDFRAGTLSSLGANLTNGDFDPVLVDQMTINTEAFQFNTYALMNNRRFELAQPITGRVTLSLSEASLNHFLQNPKTLDKLEKAVQKKTGGVKVLSFANPNLHLLRDNQVQLNVTALVSDMQMPMQLQGKLAISNDNLVFTDLKMVSEKTEVPLPVDVVKLLQKQLNDMISLDKLGKKNFIIHAETLKMKKGMIDITGHATFTRLELGG